MVLLTFVWKCFQDRNFHGVVVGLYEQSIESWVGLTPDKQQVAKITNKVHIQDSGHIVSVFTLRWHVIDLHVVADHALRVYSVSVPVHLRNLFQ